MLQSVKITSLEISRAKQLFDAGVSLSMSFRLNLKWIERHKTSTALLALMVICCAIAHSVAVSRITLLSSFPVANLPTRLIRNIAGIQFINAIWSFPLVYLLIFVGTLLYMEFRSTPRWAVWISFVLLSIPIVAYLLICLRLGTAFIVATTQP
jgi:hypothetical protein